MNVSFHDRMQEQSNVMPSRVHVTRSTGAQTTLLFGSRKSGNSKSGKLRETGIGVGTPKFGTTSPVRFVYSSLILGIGSIYGNCKTPHQDRVCLVIRRYNLRGALNSPQYIFSFDMLDRLKLVRINGGVM